MTGKRKPLFVNKPQNIFNLKPGNKILLLRQDRIGDVLISTPTLKLLREALPGIQIDILLSRKNHGAKSAVIPYINNIFVYNSKFSKIFKLFLELRKQKYKLIIDLFDNTSTTSTIIIRLLNPEFSLGIDKSNSPVYKYVVPLLNKDKYHIVERLAQLLIPFGINPNGLEFRLSYPLNDSEKYEASCKLGEKKHKIRLGINISGSNRSKFWGIHNNIEFIKSMKLLQYDCEIVLFGTNDYIMDMREISSATGVSIAPVVGSFHEYAALLNTCDVILTPDTSAVHLASAWGKHCIALYSVSKGGFGMPWEPYGTAYKALSITDSAISGISPEEVIRAFKELMEFL